AADQPAARLDEDPRASKRTVLTNGLRERTRVLVHRRHALLRPKRYGETPAHPELRDRRAGRRAHLGRARDERSRELAVRGRLTDLRPEVRVHADERETGSARDLARLGERFAGRDGRPELAVERPGDEVGMRFYSDSRRDAQPDRLRPPAAANERAEALDLVRAVDDDAADAGAERAAQLVVGLRVAVQLDARGREPGATRREELPERRDARVEAGACDQGRHADERARLHR